MIEVKETGENERGRKRYGLLIDGEPVDGVRVTSAGEATPEGVWFSLTINDYTSFERIAAYSLVELADELIQELTLKIEIDWVKSLQDIWFTPDDKPSVHVELNFIFKPSFGNWNRPYPFSDYFSELQAQVAEAREPKCELGFLDPSEGISEGFFIRFTDLSVDAPLITEFAPCLDRMREMHEAIDRKLAPASDRNAVVTQFDFPEEIRVPCEQYLLYFVQFLKDIGIEADAELRHEAGDVLFTVTPKDKVGALDSIRRALEIYLSFPANPNVRASYGPTADPRLQQLVSNIQHLESQLTLAHAALQYKEATIQSQQLTIMDQRKLLAGDVLINSLKSVKQGDVVEDKEKVLGGTVSLTKFRWKFIEFNVPDIYRRIKQAVFEPGDEE